MTVFSGIGPKRPGFIAAGVAAALLMVAAPMALGQETPASKTVATVDGMPITEADLAIAAQEFSEQLARLPPERQKAALIDVIIDIRLLARAGEAGGIDKQPDVARRLAFNHDRALRNEYLRARVFAAVNDAAVKQRFDEETAKFVPADELHVRHILVKTEDEAKTIIADLDKGGDFAAIAKEKSQDPGTAPNGGDLGFIGKGRTVKPFEDAAFALEVGKYSAAPIRSEYGWHILRLEEKRKEPAPVFEQQVDQLRQAMIRELFTKEVDTLRAAAKIEIVPDAPPQLPGPPAPPGPGAPPAPADPAPAQ